MEAKKNVTLILPRPGLIQRIIKKHWGQVINFDVVFSVSASAGPIEACIDLLLKANHWYSKVCRIQKSINLEKGILGNFGVTTYIAEISTQLSDEFLVTWRVDKKYQDELLIPKMPLADQDVQDLVDEQGSKLLLKSTDRNSCVDFDNSKKGQ